MPLKRIFTAYFFKKNIEHPIVQPVLILFPLFFYLHNANEFRDLIFTAEVFVFLIFWLLLPFVIFVIIKKVTVLNSHQVSLLTFYFSLVFFYFGTLQDFMLKNSLFTFLGKSYILIALLLIPIFIIHFYFIKKKYSPAKFLKYLNLLLIILALYESALLSFTLIKSGSFTNKAKKFTESIITGKLDAEEKPNIYHLVFDGYTSSPTLAKYWQFTNPLDSFLKSKQFYVISNSRSNYNFSPYSIASTFSMQYLKGAEDYLERNAKNFFIGELAYQNNELFKILKTEGYAVNEFSFMTNAKSLNQFGAFAPDKPVNWLRKQTLERIHLNPWILHKALSPFTHNKIPESIKKNIKEYIDYNKQVFKYTLNVSKIQKQITPQFYFIHFFLPHSPYLFDEKGSVSLQLLPKEKHMDGYRKQVEYCNTMIEKIVDQLLNNADKKIIIIQGDHGYREYNHAVPIEEQFNSLNAVYFHNYNYKSLTKDLSLVNTYRVVLNEFFNTNLLLLKDSIILKQKHN